jgi:hypothetical protein
MSEGKVQPLFGLAAEFDSAESVLAAAERVHAAGYTRTDAFSPFPVEGLPEALGFERTAVPMIVGIGGLVGAAGGFFMLWFANVVNYPWNIGGRPPNSWPAFIPITFELGVLFASLSAVIGMLALNGLPMPYHPMFNLPSFDLASKDKFFIVIESADSKFDPEATRTFLQSLAPLAVMEVPK